MLKVYGIPNCDTVKKSLDYIKSKDVAYEFHNYKKDGITVEKLNSWIKQVPLDKLVNKKGTTYKALTDDQKADLENPKTAAKVLVEKSSVIKRPLLEIDEKVLTVGFDKELFDKIL
ncbi:Spx/MgsR family RNA polymerase-binding regulatory protein [Lacihabitans sp. LS3-19]|uniref:Spx/MgsR family RNA polymerase-binding regulatory protein n=1 Tax=Lacihabitans sp. LS3-19 TaxID=2487335 RepID=UPI0020CBCAA6|nr:Spx/MgsR family RNA polymerase-binding regulatory protein [Lacihabitans sp. LS3-19]MCP9770625.1 Spx/MgsR family RNA polymerase-binding regulatory protein [Lacihabitans sp. LS3-19]